MRRWLIAPLAVMLLTGSAPGQQEGAVTLRVSFGWGQRQPAKYDGSLSVSEGRVAALEGWHFSARDRILDSSRWQLTTRLPPQRKLRPDEVARGRKTRQQPVFLAGLLVTLDQSSPRTEVQVQTAAGAFSFRLGDVPYGQSLQVLDGAGRVERTAVSRRLARARTHEDHVSLAAAPNGRLWLAFTSYDADRNGDAVLAQTGQLDQWGEPAVVSTYGDHFKTALVPISDQEAWVFYSKHEGLEEGQSWNVYASRLRAGSPPSVVATERISESAGPDIYLSACTDRRGGAWVVWQGSADCRQFDVFARHWSPQQGWGTIDRLSSSAANDWEPAVVAADDGTVYVAWDSYEAGQYDIFLRRGRNGGWSSVRRLTDSPAFEAHVSLNVDSQGRLWLAWDQSGPYWGKDSAFNPGNAFNFLNFGTRLHAGRRPRLACWSGGELRQPRQDLVGRLRRPRGRWVNEYPQVHFDRRGRLWVLYRFPQRKQQSASGGGTRTWWENAAAYWDGRRWVTDIPLPHTVNRQDMRLSAVPYGDGLLCAWSSDERPFRNPAPQYNQVWLGLLQPTDGSGSTPPLTAYQPARVPQRENGHPNEAAAVQQRRRARVSLNGRQLRLVCGDTHRHTDISADGGGDGSQYDMYRYALDAVAFDWISIGDHDNGFPLPAWSQDYRYEAGQQFTWWQTQKACDLFYLKDRFLPMFGYERSNGWPYGHRNVMNWKRGFQVVPRIREQARGGRRRWGRLSPRDLENLYAQLRRSGGVTFEHTSGTNSMGTDWRGVAGNEDVEPVAEIYQGCRTSYEYVGAPRAATAEQVSWQIGGFAPEGYLWQAWKKGLRLGVIASSDHGSVHSSYASLWVPADRFVRAELVRAVKLRRTFAATDNIVLWVKAQADGREHFMGEQFQTTKPPQLTIHVDGTAPIKQVHLIRDFQFIDVREPEARSCEYTFADMDLKPGTHQYYVRVEQTDGQLAWASPMWVTLKAP